MIMQYMFQCALCHASKARPRKRDSVLYNLKNIVSNMVVFGK